MDSRKIANNVIWKFAERILAQIVTLIVSIVLARLLSPDEYGAVAMVTVFITIANVFVTSGIPTALIQKKEADSIDYSSVLYFNIAVSLLLYFILFLAAPYVALFYKTEILCPVLRVLGIRIIVAGFNSVQHAYVSRTMQFRKYFWSTLFGTVVSGFVGIFLAYSGFGVWSLVLQYLLNTSVDTIVLYITIKWRPTKEFSWNRLIPMIRYGWKILFEAVSNTVYGQLQNLIIGRVYNADSLGYYTKAEQFPSILANNFSSSINSVLFPAMSLTQDDHQRVLYLLRKTVKCAVYVIFPLLFGMAVVAEPMVSILLTSKWLGSVPYLRIYCFIYLCNVFVIPRHQALKAIGRSDIFVTEHMFVRVINLCVLVMVYKKSVLAIALAALIGSVINTLTIMFTSYKYNGYEYKDQILDILPIIIGCIIMSLSVIAVGTLSIPILPRLIIQILIGAFVYLAYSHLFKIESYLSIVKLFIGYIKRR